MRAFSERRAVLRVHRGLQALEQWRQGCARRLPSADVGSINGRVREDFGAPDALEAQLVQIHGRQGKAVREAALQCLLRHVGRGAPRASRGTENVSLGVTRQVTPPGTGPAPSLGATWWFGPRERSS